jgi:hypothetical protein
LLSHAALGEWEQAQEIWEKDPTLLTIHGTVYHPNRAYPEGQAPVDIPDEISLGRYGYVSCTAWQIALMNEEYDEAERMSQHMNKTEKHRQFVEIFPDGEMRYPHVLAKAEVLLNDVLLAVTHDNFINGLNPQRMSDATMRALKSLRDYIKPSLSHKTGLIFDPDIYRESLRILHRYQFFLFQNVDQSRFWCAQVVEMIAGVLGTVHLRQHALNQRFLLPEENHRRGCLLPDGSSYFMFRRMSPRTWNLRSGVAYLLSEIEKIESHVAADIFRNNIRKEELIRKYLTRTTPKCIIF